jgi:magnesium chelatase subunit I
MIQFPFTAIVGLEHAKRSLIYHAIDPRIGGTLFLGHRGCAKSTLVRAFADVLQSTSNGTAPFVEVPLGTTEDRLLGSVNAETLMEHSRWQGRAGLIEEANGGLLYIDEINLLPDHLADFILDSAASGRYRMERDGITRIVEDRYILVGTMNPEEGDLRPQLSDRFAHGVRIQDAFTSEERMEIVRRRIQFDDNPEEFVAIFGTATEELKSRVALARTRLKDVGISQEHRLAVAARGEMLRLEGIRAELAVVRTARCAAAWHQRSEVEQSDIEEAWELCLGHRRPEQQHFQPPASPLFDAQSSKSNAIRLTSPAPLESRSDPLPLRAPKTAFNQQLCEWLHKPSDRRLAAFERTPSGEYTAKPRSSIAWLETLAFSARTKWLNGTKTIHLRHRLPSAKRNFWCFLDASRSTGSSRFLDAARNTIAGLGHAAKSGRFHLLVLQNGEIQWAARSSTFRRFEAALFRLNAAAGKSLIAESLKILHRAKLKKGNPSLDRLILVSDGLASPNPNEKPAQTQRRLRHALHQLARTESPVAWIHPPARRGLARWLPTICGDSKVQRVEICGDAF